MIASVLINDVQIEAYSNYFKVNSNIYKWKAYANNMKINLELTKLKFSKKKGIKLTFLVNNFIKETRYISMDKANEMANALQTGKDKFVIKEDNYILKIIKKS